MSSDDFDDIRPYRDEEIQDVFRRLLANRAFLDALIGFRYPTAAQVVPGLLRTLAAAYLGWRTRRFTTIDAFQASLENLFDHIIESTTDGFTFSGIETLATGRAYLFVSNHRDIAMDSAFLNYALHTTGRGTVRIAIGDNLIREAYIADLMRLNKSFIIRRSVKGLREQLAAYQQTSRYLHHSIAVDRQSVWIAQREGRAKDGDDRTDPAILKMFFLSQRKSGRSFGEVLADLHIVPVAVSYELDPCDAMKARELAARERDGTYEKPADEDLRSIVTGITGAKGRVHLHFGEELTAPADDPDAAAAQLDRAVHGGFRLFPTHLEAYARLGGTVPDALVEACGPAHAQTMAAFEARLAAAEGKEREWLLRQYAQPVKAALGEA
ncbi:MAG TPA: 1-acyl-sn-glycerol-3-phosphate acyltransferase [Pseudomonadales bacterium]|nr:1-acyl-sn-glycerol-3-phosphate acyltransferase [Pseudomonadales bacterium]